MVGQARRQAVSLVHFLSRCQAESSPDYLKARVRMSISGRQSWERKICDLKQALALASVAQCLALKLEKNCLERSLQAGNKVQDADASKSPNADLGLDPDPTADL